ncbi:MAG TPA: N,N-dimethylformamidase beta subunit family domain-containing protein [Candidatus Limnocylindrales bacterium]|nr:N,N-dimethylformamidase beta subunit family domain-containing protein [Candidatus Limnocylindrales bacterium]
MDRRQLLVAAARLGLGAGLAAVATACDRALPTIGPLPSATLGPSPVGPSTLPSGPASPPNAARDPAIAEENRRAGSRRWDLRASGDIPVAQVFVNAASIAPGETLNLHLGSKAEVDIEWYRLGWYRGLGGRLVRMDRAIPATPALPASIDQRTGMAEAQFRVAVAAPIPGDWPSGLYFAVARPAVGAAAGVPFVVRPAKTARVAPVLYVSASATWQAYNNWGGADLYDASSADTPTEASGRRAVTVSYDRPHRLEHGAGYMPRWELPFIRWQEREGRAVDYCADVDLELHPELIVGRRLIVFPGHHEYWSRPMRTTLEIAIASGVNVAFLSANEVYWQMRLEPSPLGPARRIVCWKSRTLDPITATQPGLTTCRWREQPVDDPEAVVIGQMYGHIVRRPADWIVQGAGHWLYEGTGFRDGDRIVNLVGQEYDTFFPELAPRGTAVLARSPVQALIRGEPDVSQAANSQVHTATIYTADSGATVFAAGTFQWSWALDGFGKPSFQRVTTPVDARVARMTRNLYDRLGDGPLGI